MVNSQHRLRSFIRNGLLITAASLVVTLALSGLADGSGRTPDYEGNAIFDRNSRVAFELIGSEGSRKKVRFRAPGLRLFCDGGATPRINPEPINARFTGPRTFKGERYIVGQTQQIFYQVKGRLLSNGRAAGSILYIDDLINQEEPVPPGDCSTQGRTPWRADRN